MVDAAGTKEPVRVTYSDGFDGLPVPSPDGKSWRGRRAAPADRPASCSSRSGITRRRWRRSRTRRRESRPEIMKSRTAAIPQTAGAFRRRSRLRRCVARRRCRRSCDSRRRVRRPARTSRRSRRRASRDGWRARTASGSPATTSCRSCRRSARKPLPGQNGFPAAVRVHRRHAETAASTRHDRRARRTATSARPVGCRRSARALSFSDNGDVDGAGRLRRLRHRRARQPGLRLRQLRDARREGQDRPRAALLPRGCRAEDARHPRALRRSALQGDGGAAARREGDARRHRAALAQRRRAGADDVRHGDRRIGHRRGRASRGEVGDAIFTPCPTRRSPPRRSRSTTPTRTRPASRCRASR